MTNINRCIVRMYRAGTGDCFLLKFFAGTSRKFTMIIDGGVWQGSGSYLEHFAENILEASKGEVDLMVITHEHKDHVLMFERCKEIFKKIKIKELWFGWTEKDGDPKVDEWKRKYGEKKKALRLAANELRGLIDNGTITSMLVGTQGELELSDARMQFSNVLNGFSELHMSSEEDDRIYKGALKGMHVIKNELDVEKVRYCKQGDIIKNLNNLPGINFYVLGPPNLYEEVREEKGEGNESFQHNKDLDEQELFSMAVHNGGNDILSEELLPFERKFCKSEGESLGKYATYGKYNELGKEWRKIDENWLFSAGNLALRMNSLTNNLSLALAIEFEESGKVMLFPGDAEFGSWESWHRITWSQDGTNGKHLTEDLLNRTVFYKVAHHLSHNGTAKSLGLDMMKHEDLVAMATLDYGNISKGWKSTMPNRAIVKSLIEKTKGRLIIMNDEGMFYDFNEQIKIADRMEEAQSNLNPSEKEEWKKDFDVPKAKKIRYLKSGQEVTEDKILYYEYSVDGR